MALHTLRIAVPSVWFGLLGALGFVETPLKFLAPGITLEIALGIGRLVLTAADIFGAVFLVAMTILSLPRPRVGRGTWWTLAGLWASVIVQLAVIRPMLNARTDIVLSGREAGESQLHTVYIAIDLIMLALLVVYIVAVARAQAKVTVPARPEPEDSVTHG